MTLGDEIKALQYDLQIFMTSVPDLLDDPERRDALYKILAHLDAAQKLAVEWLEPGEPEPGDF
jgi:hypothetical protein